MYREALICTPSDGTINFPCGCWNKANCSVPPRRGNTDRAMELYKKGIQYSQSQLEMSQAYIARVVVISQEKVCKEYGVSLNDIAARGFSGQH